MTAVASPASVVPGQAFLNRFGPFARRTKRPVLYDVGITTPGIPYVVANAGLASGSSVYIIPVTGSTKVGDGLAIVIGVGGTAPPAVSSVTDSKGNVYSQAQQSATSPYIAVFTAPGSFALVAATDTITVTFGSNTTGGFGVIAVGNPGYSATDVNVFATGSSTTPSVTGTPTYSGAIGEIALGCFSWANGNGAGTITAPFTQLAQSHPSGGAYTTVSYDLNPASGVPLTAAATVTSGAWRAVILTFKQTATSPWFMSNASYIHQMNQVDPVTTAYFFNTPAAFAISTDLTATDIQDGFTATPVLKYTSYWQFKADVTGITQTTIDNSISVASNGSINAAFKWLMYDTEDWGNTTSPNSSNFEAQEEVDDPWTYMANFVSLAHSNGFKVILAPARDLGNDPTSVQPLVSETLDHWFIRTNIAGTAAGADVVHIQDQANTLSLAEFQSFFASTSAQVNAVSTTPEISIGVSTTYGAASDMYTAAQSVSLSADGYWVNTSNGTIAESIDFLELMLGYSASATFSASYGPSGALPGPAWLNQFGPVRSVKMAVLWDVGIPPPFGPFCFAGSEADSNLYGGTETDTNPDDGGVASYGGTFTDTNLYGGTETETNLYGGTQNSGCIATMQAVNITLGEFNDETILLTVTNNSAAFNLTGYGLQAIFKTAAGVLDTDPSTLILTTGGGAITVTSNSGGLATLVIPHADLLNTSYTFWRLDVTQGGAQSTAMYGTVTMKSL